MKFKLTPLSSSSQFKQRGPWISALLTTPATNRHRHLHGHLVYQDLHLARQGKFTTLLSWVSWQVSRSIFQVLGRKSHHYFHLPQTICTD